MKNDGAKDKTVEPRIEMGKKRGKLEKWGKNGKVGKLIEKLETARSHWGKIGKQKRKTGKQKRKIGKNREKLMQKWEIAG